MLEKWVLILLIGVALFFTGVMKGCQYERDKWELASAKAEKDASDETQRRIKEKDRLLDELRKREAKLVLDRNRANSAVRLLQQSIEDRGRNTDVAKGSTPDLEAGELLGDCAERYRWMAGEADKANTAGSLCTSIYESLSNRAKVKKFIEEARK
jgi:hypothetical protein